MQIWAESGKSAPPICNYSQILYQFLAFTQNLKRSLYYGKMMYRNYQKELPLGYGQNKIVYFMILLCIIIGQYTIPSAWGRLSVILIFGVAFFLIYAMIGLHNRKNHSGELFRLYQKEVTTAKRCIIIGTGVVVVALFLVCFIKK